jgi:hypothetical protein
MRVLIECSPLASFMRQKKINSHRSVPIVPGAVRMSRAIDSRKVHYNENGEVPYEMVKTGAL